jgi:hypothetical protein
LEQEQLPEAAGLLDALRMAIYKGELTRWPAPQASPELGPSPLMPPAAWG